MSTPRYTTACVYTHVCWISPCNAPSKFNETVCGTTKLPRYRCQLPWTRRKLPSSCQTGFPSEQSYTRPYPTRVQMAAFRPPAPSRAARYAIVAVWLRAPQYRGSTMGGVGGPWTPVVHPPRPPRYPVPPCRCLYRAYWPPLAMVPLQGHQFGWPGSPNFPGPSRFVEI